MEAILVTYFLCLYFCLGKSGLLTQELLVVAVTNSHCNDHRLICDIFLVIVFVLCICKCISIRASQEPVVVAMNIDELTCGLVQPYLLSVSVSRFKTYHHHQQPDHLCQP